MSEVNLGRPPLALPTPCIDMFFHVLLRYNKSMTSLQRGGADYLSADEVRKEYRQVKEENLNLKQERQQLLERVAGFENKMQERQTQRPVVVGVSQKFEHTPVYI